MELIFIVLAVTAVAQSIFVVVWIGLYRKERKRAAECESMVVELTVALATANDMNKQLLARLGEV